MERLRAHLNVNRWLVFGGSWGSTLALAYASKHARHCVGLILRGVWLARKVDDDWFMNGIRYVYPDLWDELIVCIPSEERDDILKAYHRRLFSDDPRIHQPASMAWKKFESARNTIFPALGEQEPWSDDHLARARINFHYTSQSAFLQDGELLDSVSRFRHVPAVIIHGRYDMVCQVEGAFALAREWPEATFQVVPDAGHAATEPGICKLLIEASDRFRDLQ